MSAAEASVAAQDASQSARSVEQQEEEKLRAKFPNLKQKGPTNLLQKRLQQKGGRQFFDSGDYQMAKAKLRQGPGGIARPGPPPAPVVAAAAPPAAPAAAEAAADAQPDAQDVLEEATGHEHPTPEDVPHLLPGSMQRKASVHGQSKLTTSPTTHEPPTVNPASS